MKNITIIILNGKIQNAKMFTFIISIYYYKEEKERVKFINQVRLSFIGLDKIVYNENPK